MAKSLICGHRSSCPSSTALALYNHLCNFSLGLHCSSPQAAPGEEISPIPTSFPRGARSHDLLGSWYPRASTDFVFGAGMSVWETNGTALKLK